MLLALAGVTGVGKSFFKDKIVEKFGFEKIKIITTREMRTGEKNHEDKVFLNYEELDDLKKQGKIAYDFDLLGNTYAYLNEELFSDKNTVFELHYDTIYDFKRICPHLRTIYIMPKNLDDAKKNVISRHLSPDTEKKRLLEIDEHYNKIKSDKNLYNMFDYVVYNNFDKESEDNIINLVNNIMMEGK